MMKGWERLRYVVICIVTVVWTINFFAPVFLKNYNADPSINTVFMTIVGSLFVGGELFKKLKKPQELEQHKDPKSGDHEEGDTHDHR